MEKVPNLPVPAGRLEDSQLPRRREWKDPSSAAENLFLAVQLVEALLAAGSTSWALRVGAPDPCPGLNTGFPAGTAQSDNQGQRDPSSQDLLGP